jgi:hypothetical protein
MVGEVEVCSNGWLRATRPTGRWRPVRQDGSDVVEMLMVPFTLVSLAIYFAPAAAHPAGHM